MVVEHFKSPSENEQMLKAVERPAPNLELIHKLIREHDTRTLLEGERYYENENDIKKREHFTIIDGQKVSDENKPNNKIPHGYHKLLVDQKVSYVVGNPINFASEDDELILHLNEILNEKWDDIANELVKNASNKGVEWLHPYINEEGQFDYIITPAEQIIPIYKDKRQTTLQHVIRYYPIVLGDGEEESLQVELWDDRTVTYYILSDGKLTFDETEVANPASHFIYVENQQEEGYGWGRVPFIAFKNNEKMKSDLTYYKELIDAFDFKVSDNQNSFDEIQELIFVLKGYEGESLGEFVKNLKYHKAVSVDADGGGVDTIQAEIPMASIDSHLDRLRESIFTFGQGVDIAQDRFGAAPSGIALKFLYSLLDMKADTFERKFRTSLQELVWFVCEYLEMSQDSHQKHDYKSVDFTFKRSTMSNDLENAQIAQSSLGIISKETIMANHPWVDNLELEKQRVEKEEAANVSLGFGEGEDDAEEDEAI